MENLNLSENLDESFNVEVLSGDLLDAAVLDALGLNTTFYGSEGQGNANNRTVVVVGDPALSPFYHSFCREWEFGGRLIERHRIALRWASNRWVGTYKDIESFGPSPLVAAMRALVKYAYDNNTKLHQFDEEISRNEAAIKIFQRPT